MIDILLLAIMGLVIWCVAAEGAWDAGLICLCVVFAGLLAMNFFEPLANFLQSTVSSSFEWQMRWDIIALVGLFALFVFLLRTVTERICPEPVTLYEFPNNIGRWGCAVLTGYVTMAFCMAALHTAPLPRQFLGFTPEIAMRGGPLSRLAPDYQWLGFTQHVSEFALRNGEHGRIFDGPRFDPANPDQSDPDLMQVWSSFPIRYATRRELYAKSAPSSSGAGTGTLIRRSGSGTSGSGSERSGERDGPGSGKADQPRTTTTNPGF